MLENNIGTGMSGWGNQLFENPETIDTKEQCRRALLRTKAITAGEDDLIANLSNTSATLWQFLERISWCGFYLMRNGELVLGPFQGKPACRRIAVGKGVCGAAVQEDKTQIVANVLEFPGHIACDSASRSEIVVPIHHNGRVIAVLDIDSAEFDRFTEIEKEYLEELCQHLESQCSWDI